MILRKWNYQKHNYDKHEVSDTWNCKTFCEDLEEIVNCAQCGKQVKHGNTYVSLEIHTMMRFRICGM